MEFTVRLKDELSREEHAIVLDFAMALEKGIALKKDPDTARSLYQIAAEAGDETALNNLGWIIQNSDEDGRYEVAKSLYLKAARKQNTTAMVNLGNLYEKGLLEGENCEENAFFWYQLASALGDEAGMFNVANCYHFGIGVPQDREKAFMLFFTLAEYDYANAFFYMGLYHEEGWITEKDFDLARRFYEFGAERKDGYCSCQLGVMYATGNGVEKDIETAAKYYEEAGRNGDPMGYTNLAYFYETGQIGKTPDGDRACKLYSLAAKAGEEHAMEALERIHHDGPAPEPDTSDADESVR